MLPPEDSSNAERHEALSPSDTSGGWLVVAAATLLLAVSMGIVYTFGTFLTALEYHLGWSRAGLSSVFSVCIILSAFTGMLARWAVPKYGPGSTVFAIGLAGGLGLFFSSRVESAWVLFLSYSLLLSLGMGAGYVIAREMLSSRFRTDVDVPLTIAETGIGVGAMVLAVVSAWIISRHDWQDAFLVLGIIAWAVTIPLSAVLRKEPLGDKAVHPETAKSQTECSDIPEMPCPSEGDIDSTGLRHECIPGAQAQFLWRAGDRTSWSLMLIWITFSLSLHMVLGHVVARAEDLGFSLTEGATFLSLTMGIAVGARLLAGSTLETLDTKTGMIAASLLHASALFWLVDADQLWDFYLFAAMYGSALGITVLPGLRRSRPAAGTNGFRGLTPLVAGWGVGGGAGAYFGGYIFDHLAGYQFAFFCAALGMILATAVIWVIPHPDDKAANLTSAEWANTKPVPRDELDVRSMREE